MQCGLRGCRVTYNGPAIKAVCVGQRKCRPLSIFFRHEVITAQGGHGAVFGVKVQSAWRIRVSRYNWAKWVVSCHHAEVLKMGTGAVSRYRLPPKPEICHDTKDWLTGRGAYPGTTAGSCFIESRMFKNRDKQMTFIVRVSVSDFIFCPELKSC